MGGGSLDSGGGIEALSETKRESGGRCGVDIDRHRIAKVGGVVRARGPPLHSHDDR